jgi:hypothetical protein
MLRDKRGVLNLRLTAEGNQPTAGILMAKRLELWKPLLEQAFREHGQQKEYLLTVGEYPDLSARAAVAAVCSKAWNLKTGMPKVGDAGAAFKDLLVENRLYQELEPFFDSFGYGVSLSSAEAVMTCPWKEIRSEPVGNGCRPNAEPDSMVPCGASLVFRLAAKQ